MSNAAIFALTVVIKNRPNVSCFNDDAEGDASLVITEFMAITAASGTIYYTTDGSDPRQIGGAIGATAKSGSSGLTLPLVASSAIKTRALSSSTWSALTEADFVVKGAETPTPTSTPTPTPTPTPTLTPSSMPVAWVTY